LNVLTAFGGDLKIKSNNALTTLTGLENLTSVGGDLHIYNNDILISLTGLDSVITIGGDLKIRSNNALTSLTGLENLSSVGGDLYIHSNDALTNLTGLENIESGSINGLYIYSNIVLASCDVQSVCDYLANPNGTIYLYNNAPGCNSQQEVEDACWTKTDELVDFGNDIQIFPNPARNEIFISAKDGVIIKEINIYNQIGQKVLCKKGMIHTIDVSMLPQGMYILEVEIDNGKYRRKLIIE